MILEFADIRIHPGQQAEFEQAVQHGLNSVIAMAKGFKRYELRRCIESPERYALQIVWGTLEDHTVGFRGSPEYKEWRDIVGPFFAQPPAVEHFQFIAASST